MLCFSVRELLFSSLCCSVTFPMKVLCIWDGNKGHLARASLQVPVPTGCLVPLTVHTSSHKDALSPLEAHLVLGWLASLVVIAKIETL